MINKEFEKNIIKKKNRSFKTVVIGIISGLLAAAILIFAATQYLGLKTVVVAKGELPPFHIIQESDLTTTQIPKSSFRGTSDKNVLIGRITKTTVPDGVAILPSHLVPKGDGSLLAGKIETLKNPDLRAFTLSAEALMACGGHIKSGDKVDIVGGVQVPSQGKVATNSKEYVTKILASSVFVLETLGEGSEQKGITVALTPKQIQEIQYAMMAGKIAVALNPYTSNDKASITEPTTLESFTKFILSSQQAGSEEPKPTEQPVQTQPEQSAAPNQTVETLSN
ncbi:MAG: hypothetical protein BWY74_00035 [Firmicutes bacterium ADurb.Bin419]|nr:MAG: hypothetical protein BWY74_00035 [Firmicutes bacterium ADurb.Bin419]